MLEIKKILSRWRKKVKQYFFSYKNGFFHLYIYVNSPKIMLANIVSMPFVKHIVNRQRIRFKNPILEVDIFYHHPFEGLTLMVTDSYYKKSVVQNMMYENGIESDYYFVSYKLSHSVDYDNYLLVNGLIWHSNGWFISKPQAIKTLHHFKGARERYLILYFTEQWVDSNRDIFPPQTIDFWQQFRNSNQKLTVWPQQQLLSPDYHVFFENVMANAEAEALHNDCYQISVAMINDLARTVIGSNLQTSYDQVTNELRNSVLMAEGVLSEFYSSEFPGIEYLAQRVGISASGLKTGFSQLYGCSVFKYYRMQKMKLAQEMLLQNPDIKIKDLSTQFGYENAAKFTAAFKEELGILPSEVKIIS